ncbi:MAG: CRISPR-associated helicase Cas3' [Candidatus Competibacter sp.]|nr:CRISPR-associated helicase Cas3' [Candidatus Competibacter sp.]
MIPFAQTFAHPNDPLPEHLERVAQRAAASLAPAARPEVHRIAFLAGLFHDIGKATPYFQDYLLRTHKRTGLTSHAASGAVLAWWYGGEMGLTPWERLAVLIAVARHHGALEFVEWPEVLVSLRADLRDPAHSLARQLAALDLGGIHCWLIDLAPRHPDFGLPASPAPLTLERIEARFREPGRSQLRQAFPGLAEALQFLAGFGALLATDKIDAATQGGAIARQPLPADAVLVFSAQRFGPAMPGTLAARRAAIAAAVHQEWLTHLAAPLLTLTAPTGSGKTLAILHAALAARTALTLAESPSPRIIYCLPFTSVIDQNHAVFRAVLRASHLPDHDDLLLKHHHLVDGLFRADQAEYQSDGAGQLLTETWQSELVVTTFHQLLHTLISNRNANLKRAGQLTGALVLMDEVQAVPLRYWQALRELFRATAAALGARFVLLTATRPLIFRPEDAHELLPDHHEHFQALSRVRLYCHHRESITLDEFADGLVAEQQTLPCATLVILNRRRLVRMLFARLREAFPERRLIALSTDLTPRDRRIRIRLIQRLLRQNIPCLVISTQLVEAGVDVSFPVVHRDLAPLDSLIQSAGRCNRHAGGAAPGAVHLWDIHPRDRAGEASWQRIYDSPLIEVTREVLGEQSCWEERDFLALSQRYFTGCWSRLGQERVDELLAGGRFGELAARFQLIEQGPPTVSLFVVRTLADAGLWRRYAEIQRDDGLSPADKERLFRPFRHAFFERVIQVYPPPAPDPDNPVQRIEIGVSYGREIGFIAAPEDPATCIF